MLLGILLSPVAQASASPEPKNVLVVFSQAPGLPAYQIFFDNMSNTLRQRFSGPINFYVEYLDRGRFPSEDSLKQRFDLINQQYSNMKIDLLVLIGGDILAPVARYASPSFQGIPNIYVEFQIDHGSIPSFFQKSGSVGIVLSIDLKTTLDTALKLHPQASELYVISGSSPADLSYEKMMRAVSPRYENKVRVTYLTGLSMEEMLEKVGKITENSIILYLAFQRDLRGVHYYPREILRVIAEKSKAPIYGIFDSYLGHGIVGGYIFSSEQVGSKVGELGVRILKGEHPDTLPIIRESMNVFMFDWQQLKRFGIKEANLPSGSVVRYKQFSAWDLYGWYIIGGILFIVLQSAVVIYLIVLVRKQKHTEEQLRDAEEKYRSLYENAPAAYFSMSPEDGAILQCNTTAARLFGYEKEELRNMRLLDLCGPHDMDKQEAKKVFSRFRQGEVLHNVELQMMKKDGEPLWVKLSIEPVKDLHGNVAEGRSIVIDITESKRARDEAVLAREELRRFERSSQLGELVASLAHELNQPLAAILSNAQLALRVLQSASPDLSLGLTILRDIVQDDKRAAGVITSLRSMVKKEKKVKEKLDINEVIQDVFALFHGEAIIRKVDIALDLDRSLPLINGDKVQLQQVVLNLFMNAADAMAEVSETSRKIMVRTCATDQAVRVAVRDFGPGIDPAKLDEIFQPFFTTKNTGMGMGLSVSNSIIRLHEGRIWAENNPDGGATFFVEIPVLTHNR